MAPTRVKHNDGRMKKFYLLTALLVTALAGAADDSWQLISKGDAVARVSGSGAVHLETRDNESLIRVSRTLRVPDDAREIRVQVDWRPDQGGKAANIFTLSGADANFPIVKLRTVSGRNRVSYSTGGSNTAMTRHNYRVGHWHRIIVRVTRGVYHLAVIDRGPDNLSDFRVVFDSQVELKNPPGLTNADQMMRRFYANVFPNQGEDGYSFELANFEYRVR